MTDTPSLTEQQRAAIETRAVSIALAAGAGCGKTFVLTRRFLSQLEPANGSADLGGLVAITFTDRAAREMRERIRAACRRKLRDCPPGEVEHWLDVVRGVDSARVSTIHSFCGSLLRSFAVEASLDPRFGLLEAAGSGVFLRNAVTSAVHELLSERDADSMELVLQLGLQRAIVTCETFVYQRFRIDFADWKTRTPEDVAALWETRFREVVVPQLLRDLQQAPCTRRLLEVLPGNLPSHDKMRERCEVLLDALPRLAEFADPAALARLLEDARVQGGGGKKVWDSEEVFETVKKSLTALREAIKGVVGQLTYNPADLVGAARLGLCALRVAERAVEAYTQAKADAAMLDFDDLLLLARNLLRDHPRVRQRAAAGISFLMVDEFQDTDPVQADIVRLLCGEQLLAGKLFLVGDAQQSIYRFRRADPAVFHALRGEIPEPGRLPLSMNFRSQPSILHFVNALFAEGLDTAYQALQSSLPKQLSPPPSIEFLFAVADEGDEEDTAGTRRRREADWIARRLRQLLADGAPRIRDRDPATGEPGLRIMRPGDVVILFRALSDVRYYEEALRDHGLDYYLVGGRAFYSQQEVYDLVNLLQYLDDDTDEVSLAGVLRSPFFCLSDDTLYTLVRCGKTLSLALKQPAPAELPEAQHDLADHAVRVLAELRGQKDRLPLAALINLALERTGYDASLVPEFLGRRKLANLRKLIEMARQFDRTGLYSLADFVERLRDSVADQTDEELAATHPETSNVIRLMSIHQSKGLEFPVVVVADMDRGNPPQARSATFHNELGPLLSPPEEFGVKAENLGLRVHRLEELEADRAESLRLLYVATTRAADHLILSANMKNLDVPRSIWLKYLATRFDLASGSPQVDPERGGYMIPADYVRTLPQILVHVTCPVVSDLPQEKREAGIGLADFESRIREAAPVTLPALLQPIAVDYAARRQFSVSELEQVDAALRGAQPLLVEIDPTSGAEQVSLSGTDAELIGHVVHAVFERIDFIQPEQCARLLETWWQSSPIAVPEDLRGLAGRLVDSFLLSPRAAELAAAKHCYRELEFQFRWPPGQPLSGESAPDAPSRIITGTIDCLYETQAGEWCVIDYKTTRVGGRAHDRAVLEEYELQLGLYAWAVQELIGRPADRIELVLLRRQADCVAFDPTPAVLEETRQRVEAAIGSLLAGPTAPVAQPSPPPVEPPISDAPANTRVRAEPPVPTQSASVLSDSQRPLTSAPAFAEPPALPELVTPEPGLPESPGPTSGTRKPRGRAKGTAEPDARGRQMRLFSD